MLNAVTQSEAVWYCTNIKILETLRQCSEEKRIKCLNDRRMKIEIDVEREAQGEMDPVV